jgi:hypothetical protein
LQGGRGQQGVEFAYSSSERGKVVEMLDMGFFA